MRQSGRATQFPPAQSTIPARPTLVSPRLDQTGAGSLKFTSSDVARLILHPESAADIQPEQWPGILGVALEQGVAPQVHLKLRGQPLPESVRTDLERIYKANLARNLFLAYEQQCLRRAFEEAGLPLHLLKGPDLSEFLYADLGARQVADVDVLIRPQDLAAADRILSGAGFARVVPGPLEELQPCRDVLYERHQAGARQLFADVHLRLRGYGRRDALADAIWRDGMTQENLLLFLCLNVMTHRFARLQPWLDLVFFLRKRERRFHWVQVQQNALLLEWPAGVFFCLRIAAQLADCRVPDSVLWALAPGMVTRTLVEQLLGRDAGALLAQSERLNGPRGTLAMLGCEKGFSAKLALGKAILFPPAATLRQMDGERTQHSLPLHYAGRIVHKGLQIVRGSK